MNETFVNFQLDDPEGKSLDEMNWKLILPLEEAQGLKAEIGLIMAKYQKIQAFE